MPATWVALAIMILFFVPGFLADYLLGHWLMRAKREPTELILTALVLSLVSYVIVSPILISIWVAADRKGYRDFVRDTWLWLTLLAVLALIALPVAEAILVGNLLHRERFVAWVERWLGLRIRIPPKAWDYLWVQDFRAYVVVTFTDGSRIGAAWGRRSWASGFPAEEDIYFEVVYSLSDEGEFLEAVPYSAGVLLKRADIRLIELTQFVPREESHDAEEQATAADAQARAVAGPETGRR